jgi:hypothetical protein
MNAAVSCAVVAAVSWWRLEKGATVATGRESGGGSGRETNPEVLVRLDGLFFSGAIRWANTKTNSSSQMRAFWELAQLLGRAAHEQQWGKRSAFFLSSSLSCGCGGKTVWPATKSCVRDAAT